jgi:hypothetical protein
VDRVVAIRDGRTSSEILRRKSSDPEPAETEQAGEEAEAEDDNRVEYAVLDRAGRLQIPGNYLEAIGAKTSNKIRVQLEEGRIVLLPPDRHD